MIVPGFSGSETDWCIPVLLTLVRRLALQVDLEIFTLRYPPEARTYEIAGVPVHAFGGGKVRRFRRVGLLTRALLRIISAHRARPFDVLHACWVDEPGAVAVAAGRLLGTPVIASVMGGEIVHISDIAYGGLGTAVGRALPRYTLRRAARITAGSAFAAERLTVARDRLTILPLGVDVQRFRPGVSAVTLEGSFRILHVASLTAVKDQATLLAAMRAVVRSVPAHLHIVGDGPLRDPLRRNVAESGLGEQVTFHGEVPHDRLPDFYRAADVCVVSSRHESQCMAALEACASGVPVAGTAVGILPDLTSAARVVPVGDATGLAREVVALARDPSLRTAMGRDAQRLVESAFSIDRTVSAFQSVYSEAGRSRTAPT
jgi:glycosyltransferase involved in cell wall biosynthesis